MTKLNPNRFNLARLHRPVGVLEPRKTSWLDRCAARSIQSHTPGPFSWSIVLTAPHRDAKTQVMKQEPNSPCFTIRGDAEDHDDLEVYLEGITRLRRVPGKKGAAFTEDEWVALGWRVCYPYPVKTLEQQAKRSIAAFSRIQPCRRRSALAVLGNALPRGTEQLAEKHLKKITISLSR